MKLAIFGATGGTGRHLVEQALAGGHAVRALVRAPDRTGLPNAVDLVCGNVLDAKAVQETVAGTGAAFSCLGAKLIATFAPRGRILADGMGRIVQAMGVHGVRRLIAISTYGAGDSWHQLGSGARLMMGTLLQGELADKNTMEGVVRASGLD